MPIQDLTAQLRTRLGRVERVVGWFVLVATVLLLAGFSYYVYHTAQRRGWFLTKLPYFVYLQDASGLRVGDSVRMTGFEIGQITEITSTEAGRNWFTENNHFVFVSFLIFEPFYGYIWSDSVARVATGDLLGGRFLEVTRGVTGEPTVVDVEGAPIRILNKDYPRYSDKFDYVLLQNQPSGYWLETVESPALTDRLDTLATAVQTALPGIFDLTNHIALVLSNTANLTGRASEAAVQLQPVLTNLLTITSFLTNEHGGLGDWLIPTNVNAQLDQALGSANATLRTTESTIASVDTNLTVLIWNLNQSLIYLANITSNLNTQVQSNDQILSQISNAVVEAQESMRGLQRHWLFRRAFRGRDDP
jgi:hypothetical protein